MSFLIGLLSFFLFLTCLLLGLLILLQLPKKEAGIGGTAFGGEAAVAVFGAGTGNALTKLTKYTGGAFIGLCLLLSFLNVQQRGSDVSGVREKITQATPAPVNPPSAGIAQGITNLLAPTAAASNAAPKTASATNAPAAKP